MNNIDKFLSFFIGLETMNSILRKRYGLDVEYLKCPNCKKQSGFPTSNGMREHIKKLYPETKYWKRIRRLRNDITHGEVEFKNILDETLELLPIIENSLLNALDQFFGIEKLEYKMGESLACYRQIVGSIAVTISGPNLEYLKEHEPNISSELRNVKSLKGNKVDADLYSTIRIPEGYSFELKRINLRIMEHFADIDFKRARFKTEFIKIQ